ncbi:MAG: hypothetical protein ACPGO5_03890 [Patescibacteria group bacterium]
MSIVLHKTLNIVYSLTVATFVVTVFGFSFIAPVLAQDNPEQKNDYGLTNTAVESGLIENAESGVPLADQIGRIIGPIIGLSGSIFLALTVYSGVMWMTAAGNEERVATAKKILTAAVTGLAIVVLAYAITNFIGNVFIERAPE